MGCSCPTAAVSETGYSRGSSTNQLHLDDEAAVADGAAVVPGWGDGDVRSAVGGFCCCIDVV